MNLLEVFEAIKRRRSIRKYEETAVENEKLSKVLEAARLAPSAMNHQPYAFVVTREKETIKKLSATCNQQWVAPVMIVVCAFPEKAWIRDDGEEYWKADAAMAMNNISLQACADGLGTCWIAAFKEERVKRWHELFKWGNKYLVSYWHLWCWELYKKSSLFNDRTLSEVDPRIKKRNKIENAKQEWLKEREKSGKI